MNKLLAPGRTHPSQFRPAGAWDAAHDMPHSCGGGCGGPGIVGGAGGGSGVRYAATSAIKWTLPAKLNSDTLPSPRARVTMFGMSMPGVRLSPDAVGRGSPVGHPVT